MEPASRIIAKCGGHEAVARICGVSISRVFRWTYPAARGGTGGIIPAAQQQRLLSGARARGIKLLPEHFFADVPPVATDVAESAIHLAAEEQNAKPCCEPGGPAE